MTKSNYKEQDVVDALGALPKSVEPTRDLWPGIQARMEGRADTVTERRAPWRGAALAASVAMAFVIGLLVGRQDPEPTGPSTAAAATTHPSMVAAVQAAEREYRAAWKGFQPVGLAPSLLTIETQEDIQSSWNDMLQAEAALMTALDEHPDNPYLGEKLLDLRAQQLEFMRQLHLLDQNSRRDT